MVEVSVPAPTKLLVSMDLYYREHSGMLHSNYSSLSPSRAITDLCGILSVRIQWSYLKESLLMCGNPNTKSSRGLGLFPISTQLTHLLPLQAYTVNSFSDQKILLHLSGISDSRFEA